MLRTLSKSDTENHTAQATILHTDCSTKNVSRETFSQENKLPFEIVSRETMEQCFLEKVNAK